MLIRGNSGAGPPLPELSRRLRWVIVVMLIAFGALIGRLWQLQVVRGERYFERTVSNVVHERFLPSIRGKILDRRGESLADNRPAFNIYVVPKRFDAAVAERLKRMLGLTDEEVARVEGRITEARARSATLPVLVLEDQGRDRAALVEQAGFQLPGVEVRHEPYRFYPQGKLAAHLIGYMNQMTTAEYGKYEAEGYDTSEMVGRYGLEKEWENYLRGKKGRERYAVDARGHRIDNGEAANLIEGDPVVEPVAGHNVVLTIDAELQRISEQAVKPHAAAAVAVVEVATGRVLALVSKPSFDPNVMTGHLTRAEETLLVSDPRKPFIDKTMHAQYPPGSIFKFVTAIAALEDGVTLPETPTLCTGAYDQGGRTFRCTSSHGKVDLYAAIQHSCNVYFWRLAEKIGLDRLAEIAMEYGLGAPTGLGLNGDSPGRIPTRAWYEQSTTFKIGYTINAATGQGDVEVTVLQMAMAYAAMVNGGSLWVPQVIERVEDASGKVAIQFEPKLRRRISTPPEVLEVLRRGMWMVVNQKGGTAFDYARSAIVEYAGKSGTAQVRGKKKGHDDADVRDGWHPGATHAWFAGYAPANNPEIAIVVLIEHGGAGGKVAGPVARDIIEGYFTRVKPAFDHRGSTVAPAAPVPTPVPPVVPSAPPATRSRSDEPPSARERLPERLLPANQVPGNGDQVPGKGVKAGPVRGAEVPDLTEEIEP
jgi:penicillin-binding protein 2